MCALNYKSLIVNRHFEVQRVIKLKIICANAVLDLYIFKVIIIQITFNVAQIPKSFKLVSKCKSFVKYLNNETVKIGLPERSKRCYRNEDILGRFYYSFHLEKYNSMYIYNINIDNTNTHYYTNKYCFIKSTVPLYLSFMVR